MLRLVTRISVTCLLLAGWCLPIDGSEPLSPAAAQQTFELHPDCRIELVACEPDVIDPVHIAFAPDGKLWVVEYSDYPNGPAEGEPGKSSIRVLSDADGDGRYSDPVTFADGLIFANGLMHWRDGVLVTTNGQVLFLRDTNGDGRCDETQQWFTGFATENSQLRCNHPTFGPDNKIYIANGLRGGKIMPGQDYPWPREEAESSPPLDISGRDFRFDPFTGEYEAISGNGQFGLTFDDWGNRFVCSNRNPCNHIVLEEEHLKRAPYMRVSKVFEEVSPAGENSKLYPISRTWTTSNLHANQFTAACGVTIYRGDALPHNEFYGNSFTCEPTGNLVHRDVLTPVGITFTSRPGREGIEFLATKDEWFRPVNLAHGPDGALYVVDMYRAVIEHPQFVPDELKDRPDQLLGTDKGRIWRIVAAEPDGEGREARAAAVDQNLANFSSAELVQSLSHPNVWQRDAARQLLVERPDPAIAEDVRTILHEAHSAGTAQSALSVLQGIGRVQIGDLNYYLPAPVERFAASPRNLGPGLSTRVYWSLLALQVIAGTEPARLCEQMFHESADPEAIREVARCVGRKNAPREIENLMELALSATEDQVIKSAYLLAGLAEGLSGGRAAFREHLRAVSEDDENRFTRFVEFACESSDDTHVVVLIQLLGLDNSAGSLEWLLGAINEVEYQAPIISALAQRPEPECAITIAKFIPTFGVPERNLAIQVLTGNNFRIHLLLDLVESGQLPALAIEQSVANRLMANADPVIKEKATRLLKQEPPEDRVKVLADYQACLTLANDPHRGRELFIKNCATCHKIGDVGVNVAPDISDSRTKTPEYLLTNILDPNRAIDNNFFSYSLVDMQGRVHTGVIESETGTAVTLKQPEGKTVAIAREDIVEMKNNGVSLMPVGLEKNLTPQEMADVISFIKNWRYLDGSVPPEVIRQPK